MRLQLRRVEGPEGAGLGGLARRAQRPCWSGRPGLDVGHCGPGCGGRWDGQQTHGAQAGPVLCPPWVLASGARTGSGWKHRKLQRGLPWGRGGIWANRKRLLESRGGVLGLPLPLAPERRVLAAQPWAGRCVSAFLRKGWGWSGSPASPRDGSGAGEDRKGGGTRARKPNFRFHLC